MTELDYTHCVNEYADNIYRFVLKNIKNEFDAQDVVQSSYEKLWIHKEKVDAASAKSYLFTIAYHQLIDMVRKNKKSGHDEVEKANNLSTFQEPSSIKKVLDKAMQSLTALQKSLVLLKDYEGYSYAEIADITSLNETQVKVYLHRARLVLKNYIGKKENAY